MMEAATGSLAVARLRLQDQAARDRDAKGYGCERRGEPRARREPRASLSRRP